MILVCCEFKMNINNFIPCTLHKRLVNIPATVNKSSKIISRLNLFQINLRSKPNDKQNVSENHTYIFNSNLYPSSVTCNL